MSEMLGGSGGPTEEMSFADAKAALEGSPTQEQVGEQELQQQFQPDQQAEQANLGEKADLGATPDASTEAAEDSFMGADFNPDLLPPELQQGFKQLQGSYTKKTQELAEQRKALESLGSEEELRQITEFYHSLQDPEFLANFYNELGGVVQELGLVEAPVAPDAAQQEQQAPQIPAELAQIAQADPELTPVVERLAQMESEFKDFMAQTQQERQALAEERELMAQAAEIDRMVQVVREENPNYGDDDWQAIYDRAVALDGDVLKAAELYKADTDRIIAAYLNSKPVPHAVQPTPGAGTVTESDDEERAPRTLDEAQASAEAWLNANNQQEFAG